MTNLTLKTTVPRTATQKTPGRAKGKQAAKQSTPPAETQKDMSGAARLVCQTVTSSRQYSKAAQLLVLLSEGRPVPLTEIASRFGWQPHSARAALSGLRKREHVLVTSKAEGGGPAYSLVTLAPTADMPPASKAPR